jgi:hypothetical protein
LGDGGGGECCEESGDAEHVAAGGHGRSFAEGAWWLCESNGGAGAFVAVQV